MRDRGVVSFHFLAGESFIIQRDRLKGKYRAFDDIFDNEIFFHKFPGSCFPRNGIPGLFLEFKGKLTYEVSG